MLHSNGRYLFIPSDWTFSDQGEQTHVLGIASNVSRHNLDMTARGVMKVVSNRSYYVPVKIFSQQPIKIHKGILVARGACVLNQLVELQSDGPNFLGHVGSID